MTYSVDLPLKFFKIDTYNFYNRFFSPEIGAKDNWSGR